MLADMTSVSGHTLLAYVDSNGEPLMCTISMARCHPALSSAAYVAELYPTSIWRIMALITVLQALCRQSAETWNALSSMTRNLVLRYDGTCGWMANRP